MLDQIAPPGSIGPDIRQEFPRDIQLVVAGEDLLLGLATAALVSFLHLLGVIFDDVGESLPVECLPP